MFRGFTLEVRKSLVPHRRFSVRNFLRVTFWRLEFRDGFQILWKVCSPPFLLSFSKRMPG